MKSYTLLFILVIFTTRSYGQQEPAEYGSISVHELDNKNYTRDTASAIILFDKGSVVVEPNSTTGTLFKRHMRIKIIKKEALFEWGSRRFRVDSEAQLKVKGATYNLENGSIQKSELDDRSVLKGKYDKNYDEISVAFPNVKEGSVIDFSYTVKNPGMYIRDWQFQYAIPTRWSEYTISVPLKEFVAHLRGSLKPSKHDVKYEGEYQKWLMTDIPAFVAEPLMPDEDVYISALEFGVRYNSWNDIYNHLIVNESFSGIVHKHKYLKQKVEELIAGYTDPRRKIEVISNYIKKEIQFNGVHDFFAVTPTELFEKKTGSSGDINLLFGSMLEKAGLTVNMVLLSTRNNGFILEGFPSLSQFNYVICEVVLPDGELLVDATEKLLPYDLLPPRCFNHKGFLVSSGQYGWIGVEPFQREKTLLEANFVLTETGGLKGKLKSYKEGYAAFHARKRYADSGENDYKKDFFGGKLWNVEKSEIQNIKALDKPVIEDYDLSIEEYAILANDLIYINPYIFLREDANPFKLESRLYPIDFDKLIDNTVVCNIAIPDGYGVEELPQNKVVVLAGNAAKCTFSISQTGNKIMVMSKLQFNRTLFQPAEYGNLKEFYARIVAKKAETIVLKKKNG